MIRLVHPLGLALLVGVAIFLFLGRRRTVELLLPALSASLIALALAFPQVGTKRAQESVYFLVDRSMSVTATADAREIQDQLEAIASANPGRRFGEIDFAGKAAVVAPLARGATSLGTATPVPLGEGTDLSCAVTLALATLPGEGGRQIVLLSDGRITAGLVEATSAARRAGVLISTLAVGKPAADDAALARLDLPSVVDIRRPFTIEISTQANEAGEAVLALYRDEELLFARPLLLTSGLNPASATDTLASAGTHTYRAVIKRPGDPIPENDALSSLVQTTDRPGLLVLSPKEPTAIASLLHAIGRPFAVTSFLPSLDELALYREVLLAGVRLGDLAAAEVATLRTFTSELGGGLVAVEGEEELRGVAAGGIEELLPVSYTLPQKGREASLCVVYVLDHSGSMRGSATGAVKIDVLKEAAAASVNLLDPDALVGVIVFNRSFEWLVPIQPVGDGAAIYEGLRALEAAGGTDIYYPIVDALDALKAVDTRTKHLLVLSDGKTVDEYRDFPGLLARLEEEEAITLTAIAIGPDPNLPLLGALVQAGHGTLYVATDFSALPKISMEATQRLSRSRFVRATTAVSGPLATGDLLELPPLGGYAVTYPKPTAEVLLFALNDPILARWRVGLGEVSVLNTDLSGNWSAQWLAWEKAGLLLDAILTTAEPSAAASLGLSPSVDATDAGIVALVDARGPRGEFASFLDLEATLLPGEETLLMRSVGPGLYEATFPSQGEGAYALKIVDRTRDESAVLPFSIPYPAEYRATGVDEDLLRRIAHATGGRLLKDEVLPDTKEKGLAVHYVDIHPHLLLAALALFFVELLVRKLPRGRGEVSPSG
jgi:hypothetical protein